MGAMIRASIGAERVNGSDDSCVNGSVRSASMGAMIRASIGAERVARHNRSPARECWDCGGLLSESVRTARSPQGRHRFDSTDGFCARKWMKRVRATSRYIHRVARIPERAARHNRSPARECWVDSRDQRESVRTARAQRSAQSCVQRFDQHELFVSSLKGLRNSWGARFPSTHVLGYDCAALRAARAGLQPRVPILVLICHPERSRVSGVPDKRRFCACWGGGAAESRDLLFARSGRV